MVTDRNNFTLNQPGFKLETGIEQAKIFSTFSPHPCTKFKKIAKIAQTTF
jgi:hypothetical protein